MAGSGLAFDFPGWQFDGASSVTTTPAAADTWSDDLNELYADEAGPMGIADPPTASSNPPREVKPSTCVFIHDDDALHAILALLDVSDLLAARATCLRMMESASADALWLVHWRAHPRYSRLSKPREPCGFKGQNVPA